VAAFVTEEIASQPQCWERAGDLLTSVDHLLPPRGARVAVVGCGTSHFVAQSYASRRESLGHGETDASPASELHLGRSYDHVVLISRSGTTTEALAALERLPPGTPTTAVTADPDTPLARAADYSVALSFADERSVVQTRFATSTLVLLRAHLGDANIRSLRSDAEWALHEPLPDRWLQRQRYTFLGEGWTVGLANEAALKLRETSRSWTESYPGMEFRHGPISVVDGDSVVWHFGPPPDGLADDVELTGAEWVAATCDPLADLIRAQRLGVELSVSRCLDPDRPRHLSRSVVLPRLQASGELARESS